MRLYVLLSSLALCLLGCGLFDVTQSSAQTVQVGAGGGWAVPTSNVEAPAAEGDQTLPVDLKPGPHGYVTGGFVRSIGDNFALGGRLRAQASRLRSQVNDCENGPCQNPEGLLRAFTLEGRILVTAVDWIQPYLLVGLGVVNVTVDGVTAQGTTYEDVSVTDAGGDVGLGAALPVTNGLFLDAEVRVTGALPGGRENAVTALPFSLGLSYRFR